MRNRDIPPPDLSDLEVEHVEVDPEDNAWTYYKQALGVLYWPAVSNAVTNVLEETSVDTNAFARIMKDNEEAIRLVREGNKHEAYVTPVIVDINTPLPHVSSMRDLGRILAGDIAGRQMTQEYGEAVTAAGAALRYSYHIESNPGTLIEYLVGLAIKAVSMDQVHALIRDSDLPPDAKSELAGILDSMTESDQEGIIRSHKIEFNIAAGLIDDLSSGDTSLGAMMGAAVTGARPGNGC